MRASAKCARRQSEATEAARRLTSPVPAEAIGSLADDRFVEANPSETLLSNYGNSGKPFVPFDRVVGKKLFDKFVVKSEYSRKLIHEKNFGPHQRQFKERVGIFF